MKVGLSLEQHNLSASVAPKLSGDISTKNITQSTIPSLNQLNLGNVTTAFHSSLGHQHHHQHHLQHQHHQQLQSNIITNMQSLPTSSATSTQSSRLTSTSVTPSGTSGAENSSTPGSNSAPSNNSTISVLASTASTPTINSQLYTTTALVAQSPLSHTQLSHNGHFGSHSIPAVTSNKYEHILNVHNSLGNAGGLTTPTNVTGHNYHSHPVLQHSHHHPHGHHPHHHHLTHSNPHSISPSHAIHPTVTSTAHLHHSPALSNHLSPANGSGSSSGFNYSVKSENHNTNYDYVNNCYFGGSFSGLNSAPAITPTAVTALPNGTAGDMASVYHHQHNPVQSAKLMASS